MQNTLSAENTSSRFCSLTVTVISPATNSVAIDPSDKNHAYIASWGSGVLEYRKDGGVALFNSSNSTLHPLVADPNQLNVGGVEFDSDGNLWAIACGNTKPVSVRKPDGSWQDFTVPQTDISGYSLYNLVIDDYGQKWFCARSGSSGEGVCVFKEKSLTDPNNNSFRQLTDGQGYGSLPDMYVRSLAKDKDGSIWIGTNKGVAVVYNPGNVFSGENYDAQRIIIQYEGYNQYLLETEFVNAIAVDGANRKWFGTYSGGVFLMSADGQKQLLHFTTSNSPLPSNSINGIAIDDYSGEVFFATDKGIISYRGDANEGGDACNNYYAFPNPVRAEYHGPIAIRGLVANADVKIADVAGNVVYHVKANGGEAIWNGNNFRGERAKTGVYIVYISNEDGTQTCTTKLLLGN
jgi:streptogramin lyase